MGYIRVESSHMKETSDDLWRRYRDGLCDCPTLGLRLDTGRMGQPGGWWKTTRGRMVSAFDDMDALERGAIANPDENRRVGHYWLRAPWLAPTGDQTTAIEHAISALKDFATRVHDGQVSSPGGVPFTDFLLIGVGGSALGPQLLADALGRPAGDRLKPHFFDNTDPDGMARILEDLGEQLDQTLIVVISKSGGTPETRNGLLVAEAAVAARGGTFARQAVAVTGTGSALDQQAQREGWLERIPMWDWVGGRTSVTSAVGLLPAALQGLDVDDFLAGAAACDEVTRGRHIKANPAARLALGWLHATGGLGEKDMVVLPYCDRLLLFSRYLQQLVMESLGKDTDRDGMPVAQGIAVYGNKGSTDQHAYVQQLRDGVDNFFVTFIDVLEHGDHAAARVEVEPGITSGDYLRGFLLGTRAALTERQRASMTLTVQRVDAWTMGVLVALFERAVGFYASLINVNAYHQPGVEAGKKAAAAVLALQVRALDWLAAAKGAYTVDEVAAGLAEPRDAETLFHILEGLAANGRLRRTMGTMPTGARYAGVRV